jgi:hypothetical protein
MSSELHSSIKTTIQLEGGLYSRLDGPTLDVDCFIWSCEWNYKVNVWTFELLSHVYIEYIFTIFEKKYSKSTFNLYLCQSYTNIHVRIIIFVRLWKLRTHVVHQHYNHHKSWQWKGTGEIIQVVVAQVMTNTVSTFALVTAKGKNRQTNLTRKEQGCLILYLIHQYTWPD